MKTLVVIFVVVTQSCPSMLQLECTTHEDCYCHCDCIGGKCEDNRCACYVQKRALSEPLKQGFAPGERRAQFEEFLPEEENCKKAHRFIKQHCVRKPILPKS